MRAAALLLCAGVLVAGCGGDDDDETTVVETTTTTTIETVPVPGEPDVTTPDNMGERVEPPEETQDNSGAATAPSNCGRIAFSEATDSGASGITAVGTDCDTARTVARGARNASDDLTYEAESFKCSGTRSEKAGLSAIEWFCIGADREVVSFVTT